MELTDLRYFATVAELQNINRAAERLNLTPGAISKAVARLETELDTALFHRERQRIRLTDAGLHLQTRASHLINLEEDIRFSMGSQKGVFNLVIGGEDLILGEYAAQIIQRLRKKHFQFRTKLIPMKNAELFKKLKSGEVHIGLTSEIKKAYSNKKLGSFAFKTVAGTKHQLSEKSDQPINIAKLLEFGFIYPDDAVFGPLNTKSVSFDGWRDDKFPRKIIYRTPSIYVLSRILEEGLGLAYLPEYMVKSLDVKVIDVVGCPYSCEQMIYMTTPDHMKLSWLNQIF